MRIQGGYIAWQFSLTIIVWNRRLIPMGFSMPLTVGNGMDARVEHPLFLFARNTREGQVK
jgi:hypothetical protein